ncbi:MAG: YbaK/EbsC family protein [Atribacterota bacterium]|jgi:Cys-tRNA(Pro) deacylase|nr:YbaK/EbsC family protein [Atribacterota bacterium]MDI9596442.1 YbaK/EbsC family protein [Atribacterota bacterium]
MSVEDVRKYFKNEELDYKVVELEESTATVDLAAKALGVKPALIAKTLSFKLKDDRCVLLVTKGDARIDNRKYKDYFRVKAKMLNPEEVFEVTGHEVGGVCPFGLKNPLDIYLDESLLEFEFVFPAAGSGNSFIKITPEELQNITNGTWVAVCK